MNIEEAVNRYLELKPCKNWIESIEPSFFFEFAETVITAYEKEKEKNKSARDMIEYYLIENNSLNDFDKRNKELKKLEKVLEE